MMMYRAVVLWSRSKVISCRIVSIPEEIPVSPFRVWLRTFRSMLVQMFFAQWSIRIVFVDRVGRYVVGHNVVRCDDRVRSDGYFWVDEGRCAHLCAIFEMNRCGQ